LIHLIVKVLFIQEGHRQQYSLALFMKWFIKEIPQKKYHLNILGALMMS